MKYAAPAPAVLYAALIWFLSSLSYPFRVLPHALEMSDVFLHLGEYAMLSYLLALALWGQSGKRLTPWTYFALAAAACVYGLSDEWHQSFVPGREAALSDVLSDCAGTVLGAGLFYASGRLLERFQIARFQKAR